MKLYYLGWLALYVPLMYAMEHSPLEEKMPGTIVSLQEMSLNCITHNIEKYTPQDIAKLNENLLNQLLNHQRIASLLPAIIVYTPKIEFTSNIIVQAKSWTSMKLNSGEYLYLRRLGDNYPSENNNDFFYVQGKKNKTRTNKFGLNNLNNITCLAIHPQQINFAVGRDDGSIAICDLIDRSKYIEHHFYSGQICLITYNKTGSYLIAVSEGNKIVIWNTQAPYAAIHFPNIQLKNDISHLSSHVREKAFMFSPLIEFNFLEHVQNLDFFYNKLSPAQKVALICFVGIKKLIDRLVTTQQNILQTESALYAILNSYRQYLIDTNFEQPVEDTLLKCIDKLTAEF